MSTITVVRVPVDTEEPMRWAEIDDGLAALQAEVGGLVECVRLDDRVDMWINEEGKLENLPVNPRATSFLWAAGGGMFDSIAGPAVLACHDEDGGTTSLQQADVTRLRIRVFA